MDVHKSSCHPNNVKKCIPYGLGVRIRRICNNEDDYRRNRNALKHQLRKRGYIGKFSKASSPGSTGLIEKNNGRVPLVLTYSNLLPDVHKNLKKHQTLLEKSEKTKQAFASPPIVAYRRDSCVCGRGSVVAQRMYKITIT